MRRTLLIGSTLVAVVLVASGCQTLGDRFDGRFTGNEQPTDGEVVVDTTPTPTEPQLAQPGTTPRAETYNNIFFRSTTYDPQSENCGAVYWVHIPGGDARDPVAANLRLLLAGPTSNWVARGYYSVIPAGTTLLSARVEGSTVYADFSKELNTLAGSCAVTAARKQIEQTAKFAAQEHLGAKIDRVVVSVEGDSATALQP